MDVEPTGLQTEAPGAATHTDTLDGLSREERDALEVLGYLSATQLAPEQRSVTRHDRDRAWAGLNLWVSAHGEYATLMDMEGEVLHKWAYPTQAANAPSNAPQPTLVQWRRVHLFPNGDLLVQRDLNSALKLDKESKLLWKFEALTHHDVVVSRDQTIFILTSKRREHPFFDAEKPIVEDFVVQLGSDGREMGRVSLIDALVKGGQMEVLQELRRRKMARKWGRLDITHTNALEVLDGTLASKVPAFRKGNILLSLRTIDTILVLDFKRRAVVWTMTGTFKSQHDPTMLANGSMLVFDNGGTAGRSAVLEIDPATRKTLWAYRGSKDQPFFSLCCGTAQRLPNGNTLVVETEKGRAFEVTREGEIVWEFYNPHRLGIKMPLLLDVVRVDSGDSMAWLHD